MMAALQQDLHAPRRGQLIQLLVELLAREHVMVVILFRPIKRAEFAIDIANVGVIDVAIDDVSDDLAAPAPVVFFFCQIAPRVGQRTQLRQGQTIKFERFGR